MINEINASSCSSLAATAATSSEAKGSKQASLEQLIKIGKGDNTHSIHCLLDGGKTETQTSTASRDSIHSIQDLPGNSFRPLNLSFSQLPLFPTHCLPKVLGDIVRDVALSTKTEEALAAGVVLACVSACSRGRWRVVRADHNEPLILWTLPTATTGSLKSPVFTALTAPIRAWEKKQATKSIQAENELKAKHRVAKLQIEQIQQSLKSGDIDTETAVIQIADQESILAEVLPSDEVLAGNITTESLFRKMSRTAGAISVFNDEGGIFDVMMGMYNSGQANYDLYLDGYSNTPTKYTRANADISIESPAITICACVQPAILQALAKGQNQAKGLLARFLYLLPESSVGKRNVRTKHTSDLAAKDAYNSLIEKLLGITPNRSNDEEGTRTFHEITITPEAEEAFFDFWQPIEDEQGEGGMYSEMVDWTAKAHGQLLRIAGVLHLVEHGIKATMTPIDKEVMTRAVEIMRFFLAHATRAYELMGIVKRCSGAEIVLKYLLDRELSTFKESDIHSLPQFRNGKKEALEPIFKTLEYSGVIGPRVEKKNTRGPVSKIRMVNPEIFETPVSLDRMD